MSSVSSAGASSGLEMVGLALAKTQQEDQGRQSLKLLDSAAASTQQIQASAPPAVGNIGQNINIKV